MAIGAAQPAKDVIADGVDFNRDIRPLLSYRCFLCHGPDAGTRQADLRLDSADAAHQHAIVPGKLDESDFWNRINSDDPGLVLPPTKPRRHWCWI
ncbi:MAG: c-type cytochrome domain-containing protein [Rubripirellula sp.]